MSWKLERAGPWTVRKMLQVDYANFQELEEQYTTVQEEVPGFKCKSCGATFSEDDLNYVEPEECLECGVRDLEETTVVLEVEEKLADFKSGDSLVDWVASKVTEEFTLEVIYGEDDKLRVGDVVIDVRNQVISGPVGPSLERAVEILTNLVTTNRGRTHLEG